MNQKYQSFDELVLLCGVCVAWRGCTNSHLFWATHWKLAFHWDLARGPSLSVILNYFIIQLNWSMCLVTRFIPLSFYIYLSPISILFYPLTIILVSSLSAYIRLLFYCFAKFSMKAYALRCAANGHDHQIVVSPKNIRICPNDEHFLLVLYFFWLASAAWIICVWLLCMYEMHVNAYLRTCLCVAACFEWVQMHHDEGIFESETL